MPRGWYIEPAGRVAPGLFGTKPAFLSELTLQPVLCKDESPHIPARNGLSSEGTGFSWQDESGAGYVFPLSGFNFRLLDNPLTTLSSSALRRVFTLLTAALSWLAVLPSTHADPSAVVVVTDRLSEPGEEVAIDAYLYRTGVLGFFHGRIQGELLKFFDGDGNPLGDLLTDPSGLARIHCRAGAPGRYPITARLAENPRYSADPSTGNLFVRERNLPLFFVAVEQGLMPPRSTPFLPKDPRKVPPQPGSTEALSEVAHCHVPVYLSEWPRPSSHQIRSWLETRGYPAGPIYFIDRPLLAGMMSEPSTPDTAWIESLWKERSQPARLVTRDRSTAEAAAAKGVLVLLLTMETSDTGTPLKEEGEEDRQGERGQEEGIVSVQAWSAINALCPCETGQSD